MTRLSPARYGYFATSMAGPTPCVCLSRSSLPWSLGLFVSVDSIFGLGLLNAGDFTGRFDRRNENSSEEMLAVLIRPISPAAVSRRAAWPSAWT